MPFDVRSEKVVGMVSAAVSAGDGLQAKGVFPEPITSAVPNLITWAEMLRRLVTHITTPSSTILIGASNAAVAVAFEAISGAGSGIQGMFQGVPFYISATGTLSGSPISSISTASNTIRKVLVCIGMSALPAQSSLGLGGGTVQFTYGSAYATSAGAVTGGAQSAFFDKVPLPVPSAGEIPVGWINVHNSFAVSAAFSAPMLYSDYRVLQGLDLSALLAGIPQP